MQPKASSLNPCDYDSRGWCPKVIRSPIHLDGKIVAFEGEALVTEPSSGHSLEFELQTRFLQTAAVKIPLWVSRDASLTMFFNNELVQVEKVKRAAIGAMNIHFLEKDVSRWAERCRNARIRLLIVYCHGDGSAVVPVEHRSTIARGNVSPSE